MCIVYARVNCKYRYDNIFCILSYDNNNNNKKAICVTLAE